MNNDTHRETATVIQFPTRAALAARRFKAEVESIKRSDILAEALDGASWYHAEAMAEERKSRN